MTGGKVPARKRKPAEKMSIRYVPTGSVVPYSRNARKNGEAVAVVAKSLERFGWQQPIVVDKSNVVIVGHTRLAAAAFLGMTKVPILVATNLTANQVKAYRLADNKTGEVAEWDKDLLGLELADLEAAGFDLDETGFESLEVGELLSIDEPAKTDRQEADKKGDDEYGGGTSIARGSAPLRYWRESGLLVGEVLDFGAGKEIHDFARYDMVTQPDPSVLLRQYDSVTCNYVLNVQPTDHLVDLVCVLLWQLVKPGGNVLVSVVVEKKATNTRATGGREVKPPEEWEAILSRFFNTTRLKDAKFCGFLCTHRGADNGKESNADHP